MQTTTDRRELVIIGAGIIGLAHAVEARRLGLSVTLLDRELRATGASVRNFGHACFTAQPSELSELAMSSREGWLAAATGTGIDAWQCGTLVVARSQLELDLLQALREARGDELVQLHTAGRTRAMLGGLGSDDVLGGAHLPLDVRVDPRRATEGLAAWLQDQGVEILRPVQVGALETKAGGVQLTTSRGMLHAERVVLATGHDLVHLLPELATSHQVQRCTLAMHRVAAPGRAVIEPAVFTTTSMLRYGAFTELGAAGALREHVQRTRPDLLEAVANVMFTQLPDGSLLVGDTHDYSDSPLPFIAESRSRLVLDEAAAVLGVDQLDVLERWQGIYANSVQGPLLVEEPLPGVRVVTVTSGVGMTLSFGLARQSLATF